MGGALAMSISLIASADGSHAVLPNEELLLFLAESIDVDGELLDPMAYLELVDNESDGEGDDHSKLDQEDKKSQVTFKEGISYEQ